MGSRLQPKVERLVMADVVDAADPDDGTSGTARALIYIPSGRLVVTFSLGYELATAGVISSYTSSAWSATMVRPADQQLGGRECDLHALFTSATLPKGWGVVGVVDEKVSISAALAIPQVASVDAPGQWVLTVKWEPAESMCAEEWAELDSQCWARVVKRLLLDIA